MKPDEETDRCPWQVASVAARATGLLHDWRDGPALIIEVALDVR